MQPANINLKILKNIIVDVAKKELLPRFANVSHTRKADKSIVTEADIAAQKNITAQLINNWPEIQLLGEEMTVEQQEKILATEHAIWCLDPLDGTTNFAAGIPYFAISLALIFRGEVILGAVYDPVRNEYFFAQKNKHNEIAVTLNDQILNLPDSKTSLANSVAIVDLKRLSKDLVTRVATQPPFASQRNFGASALDWCWMAAGRAHLYLHGKQNIWDYAAGEFIFRAAGGKSATLDNEAVFKQALEQRSVVAAINDTLFKEWTHWLNIK